MLRIFRHLGQPRKEGKHKTCSFSGAGLSEAIKIAGQQQTERFFSENLSVKLLPGHLMLRFIHCLAAMARCSVLTVHIQSALHPIFYKTDAYLARMERSSHNIFRQRQHFIWMNPVQLAVIR